MNIGKLILLILVVCLMFTGKTYSFLSDTEISSNNRFAVSSWWIQTTQAHFESGSLNNTETITSPGDVLLSGQFMTDSDTVGLWHFNEGNGTVAYDETTNNNDGAINGATWTTGKYGSSLDFDGDDYVDCGNDVIFNIDQGTWELWLKFSSKPSDAGHLMNPLAKQEQYWIHASSDDSIQAKINVGGTRYITTTGSDFIETDVWYHVAGTYDGEELKLYVNGTLIDTNTDPSGNLSTTSNILAIGTWSSPTDYFVGTIDEVRVSNIAKTSFPVDYFTSGNFESRSYNTGISADFDTIKWNETLPANTDLKFQIATNTDNSTWNFLGPDGTSSTYYTTPNGEAIWSDHDDDQYIKFKAFLEGDTTVTPALHDVTIYYGSV
jgi:hypothetical protein